jgi:hypothetical protein
MHQSRLTRSSAVTLQRIGQEAVLYDRRNGRAHVINASAVRIWDLCTDGTSIEDIVPAFAAFYDMPTASVYDDVVSIISSFRALDLVV